MHSSTVQCTVYSVQVQCTSTVNSENCTVYSVPLQNTVYSVHCTSTEYCVQCTGIVYRVQCTGIVYCVQCTGIVYSVHCTVYIVPRTVYSVQVHTLQLTVSTSERAQSRTAIGRGFSSTVTLYRELLYTVNCTLECRQYSALCILYS